MKNKKTLAYDISAVALVVLFSFLLGFLPSFITTDGNFFILSSPEIEAEYSLFEDRTIELGYASVIVEDGTVRIENSTCGDKICERTGAISKAGESIICVPNRISIVVWGETEVDSVAG